ncbi:hypothetical protein BCR37DRAFT_109600 [Protomyces lactucae-debilis]|uniref:Uncharacterized protein n=1 Tax=Protomyces lactucae-debilis TaxID=2754530 RepID=A0A1Y2F452_PROLT|nr:uncharacterized protein BCR37DRAFT_109600 [Protomyces lactucae-debilis]ORY78633.1 hypothetical protein BCR37DRAFT_109600 [Protomyces lactucae-debilis]
MLFSEISFDSNSLSMNSAPAALELQHSHSIKSASSAEIDKVITAILTREAFLKVGRWAAHCAALAAVGGLDEPAELVILDDIEDKCLLEPSLSISYPDASTAKSQLRCCLMHSSVSQKRSKNPRDRQRLASVRLAERAKQRFALDDSSSDEDADRPGPSRPVGNGPRPLHRSSPHPSGSHESLQKSAMRPVLGSPFTPPHSSSGSSDGHDEDDMADSSSSNSSSDSDCSFLYRDMVPVLPIAQESTTSFTTPSSPGGCWSFSAAAGSFLSLPSVIAGRMRRKKPTVTPAKERFYLSDGESEDEAVKAVAAGAAKKRVEEEEDKQSCCSWAKTDSEYEYKADDSDRYRIPV